MKWGKRLALAVGAIGTTAALVATASFALFTSAANPQTDTFAAGTVILNSAATGSCDVTNMEPGDSSAGYPGAKITLGQTVDNNGVDPTCAYTITYSGSLAAWIGLSLGVNSVSLAAYTPSGSATQIGGSALYNGDSNGLQVQLLDSNLSLFQMPAVTCTENGAGTQQTCSGSSTSAQLVPGAKPGNGPNNTIACAQSTTVNTDCSVNNGWTDTFHLDYYLPLNTNNSFQGSSATFTLTAQAVQESNNPLNGSQQPTYGWNQCPTGQTCSNP